MEQNEYNSSHFVIERSTDGNNFMWVKKVAAAGNSSIPLGYSFYDNYPVMGTAIYRLVMVDINGTHTFSGQVAVNGNTTSCFTANQPGPVNCSTTMLGPDRLCYENERYIYSLSNIPDYTYITWSVSPPSQSLATSTRHYSNKFELTKLPGNGNISVTAVLSGCSNSTVTKPVAVGTLPLTGVAVLGADLFCTSAQFSVQNLPSGSTVLWSSSNTSAATIDPTGLASGTGNGTSVITATITPPASTCYGVTVVSKTVIIGNPVSMPISIYPPNADLCAGIPFMAETYLNGATSYNWVAPSGLQFTSANGLDYINAQVVSPPLGGPLTVTATNQCGSASGSINLIPQPQFPYPGKDQPYITLLNASCLNNTFTGQVVAVPNAVSYTWRVREFDQTGNLLYTSPWFTSATNQATYNLTNPLTRSATVYVYATTNCGVTPIISETFNRCGRNSRLIITGQEELITVVPNPTTGICRVNLPAAFQKNSTFTISDANGKQLNSGTVGSISRYLFIDLGRYPNGTYTLTLKKGLQTKFAKIVKN